MPEPEPTVPTPTATRCVEPRPPSMLDGIWSMPNAFTLARLLCLPIFLYLLFGRDNQAAAAWMLGALGATDWVDGYLARRLNQVSEFGKVFDPTADRLLFIVAIVAIMIDGSMPIWFGVAVLAREVLVGLMMVIATLVFKMERIDVTWLGKCATFLLMFAVPGFLMGNSDFPGRRRVRGRGVDSRHSRAGTQLLDRTGLHPRGAARESPAIGRGRPPVLYRRPLEDGYGCAMNVPADLRYSTRTTNGSDGREIVVTIGITEYAQDSLGDIVFVEAPDAGRAVAAGDSFTEVESTKSVSDIYAPVSGSIAAINDALEVRPELLNSDPYGDGWICTIEMSDPSEFDALLDADAYRALTEG